MTIESDLTKPQGSSGLASEILSATVTTFAALSARVEPAQAGVIIYNIASNLAQALGLFAAPAKTSAVTGQTTQADARDTGTNGDTGGDTGNAGNGGPSRGDGAGDTAPPGGPIRAERLSPAVPIRKSVTPEFLICLEDGKKLKMLKRHLRTMYGLTPEQYREKWGLPIDYPMTAPNYAKLRSDFAKTSGLGQKGPRGRRGEAAT